MLKESSRSFDVEENFKVNRCLRKASQSFDVEGKHQSQQMSKENFNVIRCRRKICDVLGKLEGYPTKTATFKKEIGYSYYYIVLTMDSVSLIKLAE